MMGIERANRCASSGWARQSAAEATQTSSVDVRRALPIKADIDN